MELRLLPLPKLVDMGTGTYPLPETGEIVIQTDNAADQLFTAKRLQTALQAQANLSYDISAGPFDAPIILTIDHTIAPAQGYQLDIDADGVMVVGSDVAGLFYGVVTLIQLLETEGTTLPQLTITDSPDFPNRGLMLDISRDKVPTMETLYDLIDMLASWKINQFQLYTEHTFAYRNHKKVWENASPITAEEILLLDAYCKERFIDLVPNQNSFGHMHRWFEKGPEYLALAESEHDTMSPWGSVLPPFSLSPAVPGSIALVREMFDELLPNFTSQYFNVGCDETFDLGVDRTKAWCDTKGKGRVYLDFLLQIYSLVSAQGRTMQFWGDIINQYPELVPEIPKDTIALEWGYEADHDYPGKSKLFSESGIPFYVCPGTSSWTTITGRTDNCMKNISNAVENGLKYGAIGVLNTDWGDRGHWQTLPVSYLGYAYGAALSWAYEQNADIDIAAALDAFAFRDQAGVMGKLAYDLGNAYQAPGALVHNGNILFWLLQRTLDDLQESQRLANDDSRQIINDKDAFTTELKNTLAYIERVMAPLEDAQMQRPDGDLIQREFAQGARMLQHAARHTMLQLGTGDYSAGELKSQLDDIVREYKDVWLSRNRPGGLDDSVAYLDPAYSVYKA
ncbi:family 20 glycosylhydrolase [Phototrophicus methaneseepsis]|uniref:beta-N-acetylhexosaminidase n=1 Tax=Phototrophicus methaneseepsis TaxID=2710758 RepID=A0A7S8EBU1_9CHLR|nr:glycoside hydrolase family 20 zincin-like fold domain-containing protein [Phototrophicus methaneseepsis]QPC84066.1 family 20 glycosylhydrolase [Phototrophicus methaneseepsis]